MRYVLFVSAYACVIATRLDICWKCHLASVGNVTWLLPVAWSVIIKEVLVMFL